MSKSTSQRNERILNELRSQDAYKECADCGNSRPAWASWNLGITLCVACAQIHRALGTDISKVKSMTLDVWTKEQVDSMKATGNIKSNARFNPDLRAHPPPTDLEGSDRNSQMQRYITKKYRDRAFVARKKSPEPVEDVALPSTRSVRFQKSPIPAPTYSRSPSPEPKLPDLPSSSSANRQAPVSILRSRTAPLLEVSRAPSAAGLSPYNPFNRQMTASAQIPSQPYNPSPSLPASYQPAFTPSLGALSSFQTQPAYIPSQLSSVAYRPNVATPQIQPKGGVWDDLAGLSLSSAPSPSSQTWSAQPMPQPASFSPGPSSNPFLRSSSFQPQSSGTSLLPHSPYASSYQPQQSMQPSFVQQSMPSGYPQQSPSQYFPSSNPFSMQPAQPSFNTLAQAPQNPYATQMSQQQYQYSAPQPSYQYQQNFG